LRGISASLVNSADCTVRTADDVLHPDNNLRILRGDLDALNLDELPSIAADRPAPGTALPRLARCRSREHRLQKSAAKSERLTRSPELVKRLLLDELFICVGSSAGCAVRPGHRCETKVDILPPCQIPVTRTSLNDDQGVRWGHKDCYRKQHGTPWARTRSALVMNCAVTHGPLPLGGGGKAQPATT